MTDRRIERPVGKPTVRSAVLEDRDGVEQLLRASDLPVPAVTLPITSFTVAHVGTEIVGVAGLEVCGEYGLLRSVAISPAWRNQGLAHALVTEIIAAAGRQDLQALYLLTTTAAGYFPRFGFSVAARDIVPREIATTDEFTFACPATAVAMVRERSAE